jgi:3-isopropylmalate/(R)-2-methylmalate dehydratase small subunit
MNERSARPMVRRGRCHIIGGDISLDDGIIPRRFAAQRVTAARELTPYLFESVDPEFGRRVRHGDIVLAGKNFACGKPRVQGFIAMAALDLAVVCTSMPYKMLRRAVARAIPVVVGGPDPQIIGANGDEVEVDFSTGAVWNLTRDVRTAIPPMPEILCEIVASGGIQGALQDWLVRHPDQAVERE